MTAVTIVYIAACVFLLADALYALVDPRRYVGAPARPRLHIQPHPEQRHEPGARRSGWRLLVASER
jgi:hypothetical protein